MAEEITTAREEKQKTWLKQWEQTRKKGRNRFVLLNALFVRGPLFAIIGIFVNFRQEIAEAGLSFFTWQTLGQLALLYVVAVVIGSVAAYWEWQKKEDQYADTNKEIV